MAPTTTNGTFPAMANRSVDDTKPLRVIAIGAGISGLLAGIKLPRMVQKLDLVIYDKNEDLGGTWFENKYPGCACDIPAHCYQLSFESNPAWGSFYASASEILGYWKRIAVKYDLYRYLRLSTKVEEARWNEETAKWHVKLHDLRTDTHFEDVADVVIQGIGSLNSWKWPAIEGLHSFQGKLLHSAMWDEAFDYKGKRVAVVGAGSSGIQITPTIQPHVSHLVQFIRGKTWISNQFVEADVIARLGASGGNFAFTQPEIEAWRRDPRTYLAYRRVLEQDLQSHYAATIRGTDEQLGARPAFTKLMSERLQHKRELVDAILPDFPPVCRRLTPGPGFLEALTKDNVEVVTSPIARIDAAGLVTAEGTHRAVDAIVCATGFDTSYTARFPCIGRGGVSLADKWREFPSTYMSIATDGFPNMFMSLGPNAALGAGNLLLLMEAVADYVGECCAKIQREAVRSMAPTAASVARFRQYCDEYFRTTVFSDKCSSWYKGGSETGPVMALWPGSSLHAAEALRHPRWEDWEYEYEGGNPWAWFGDGSSWRDWKDGADRAFYLEGQLRTVDDPLDHSSDVTVGRPMHEDKQ